MASPPPSPPASLFALAPGGAWAESPLPERRARRVLARLGARVVPAGARPPWTPGVTHVVAPAYARSRVCVCGGAAGAAFVTPAYVAACDAAGALLDVGGFVPDAGAPRTPRLWPGAAGFWRRVGPPLRGHRVAILGELCPLGAAVLDSATSEVMLRAAGAVVVAVGDAPTFALAPAMIAEDDLAVRVCVDAGVPCLGAAFVPDLIACAQAKVGEYLAVRGQRVLVVDEISTGSYDGLREGEAVPITQAALAALGAVNGSGARGGASEVSGDGGAVAVGTGRSGQARARRRGAYSAAAGPPRLAVNPGNELAVATASPGGGDKGMASEEPGEAAKPQARDENAAPSWRKGKKRKSILVGDSTPLVATRRSKRTECSSVYRLDMRSPKVSRQEEKGASTGNAAAVVGDLPETQAACEVVGRDNAPHSAAPVACGEAHLTMDAARAAENEDSKANPSPEQVLAVEASKRQDSTETPSTRQPSKIHLAIRNFSSGQASGGRVLLAQSLRAPISPSQAAAPAKSSVPEATVAQASAARAVVALPSPGRASASAAEFPTPKGPGSNVDSPHVKEGLEAQKSPQRHVEGYGAPQDADLGVPQRRPMIDDAPPCSPSLAITSRKRRRVRVIAESPPSDDEDGCDVNVEGSACNRASSDAPVHTLSGVPANDESSDADDDALSRPVFPGRVALQRRDDNQESVSNAASVATKGRTKYDQTDDRVAELAHSPSATSKPFVAPSVRCDPHRRRIRLRTPAPAPATKVFTPEDGDADGAAGSKEGVCAILSMQNLNDEVVAVESSPEGVSVETEELAPSGGSRRCSGQDDGYVSDDAQSALSLLEGKHDFGLPNLSPVSALALVMDAIGGQATEKEVQLLLVKNRDAAAEAARLEREASAEGAAEALDMADDGLDEGSTALHEGLALQDRREDMTASTPVGLNVEAQVSMRLPVASSSILLPPVLPSELTGIDSVWERSVGVAVDDDIQEAEVKSMFWLLSAERVCVGGMRNRVSSSVLPGALARQACLLLAESGIMSKLLSSSCNVGSVDTFVTKIGGYCGRLLQLDPPEDVVVMLATEFMNVRELQLRESDMDSLHVLLTSPRLPPLNRRHHVMAVLWAQLLLLCERSSNIDSFWSVFDRVATSLRSANFSAGGRRLVAETGPLATPAGPRSCAASTMTDWEEWAFRAATAFGSLYCVELCERAGERRTSSISCHSTTLSLATPRPPNWKLLSSLLVALKGDIASGSAVDGYDYDGIEKRLFELLHKIVVDVACQLWPVEEEVVFCAIDAVHLFYRSRAVDCGCAGVPEFLWQLRSRNDIQSRHDYLFSHLKTPCDCLVALSWLFVADSQLQVSAKVAGRIVSLSSRLIQGGRSSGYPHALSLMLAAADAIAPPGSEALSKEKTFCALLFSKAPVLSKALNTSSGIGYDEKARWSTLLQAVLFRSRSLASSGRSFICYVERTTSCFTQAVRVLERPDAANMDTVSRREAARIQHILVLEISVQLLDTVRELVGIALGMTASDELASSVYFALLDSVFDATSTMVTQSGKLVQGILSQLRLPSPTSASSLSRRGILVASVRTLHSLVNIAAVVVRQATRGACHNLWKDSFPGLHNFLVSLEACSLPALIDIVHNGVVLDDMQVADEVRLLSVAMLARVVGLRSLVLDGLSSGDQALAPALIVRRCGMDFWSSMKLAARERQRLSTRPKPKPPQPPSQQLKRGRKWPAPAALKTAPNQTNPRPCEKREPQAIPITPVTREGRAMMATFWSHLVDSLWSSSVLESDPVLERMVIAVWIVLLSAPEVVNNCHPVLSLAWSLKAACTSRPVIASFFRETLLHDRMVESDPGLSFVVVTVRPETVADALSVCVGSSGFFSGDKLFILLDALGLVVSQGGFDLSNPAWKCTVNAGAGTSLLSPLQCSLIHSAFAADLSALLFAIRGALGKRLMPLRLSANEGTDPGFRALDTVSEALSQIANISGRGTDKTNLKSMFGRVAAFVYHGAACVGADHRSVELRVRFSRFAKLVGAASFQDLVVPMRHLKLPKWLLHLGLPVPYRPDLNSQSPAALQMLRSRQSAGEQWRLRALHSLVHDPLTVSAFGSSLYHQATERLLLVLVVHEQVRSSAADVSQDVQAAMSKIVASLPSSNSDVPLKRDSPGQSGVSKTIDVCQQVGFKVEAMYSDSVNLVPEDQAHARALAGLGAVLIAEATAILMEDAF